MKRIFLSIVIIALSAGLFGQCKYVKNEVDEFTGEKILITKGNFNYANRLDFIKNSEGYSAFAWISLDRFLMLKEDDLAIKKGAKIYFKTVNGDVITIEAKDDYFVEGLTIGGVYIKVAQAHYSITEEKLKNLKLYLLESFRIETTEGNFDKKFNKTAASSINQAAKCILE